MLSPWSPSKQRNSIVWCRCKSTSLHLKWNFFDSASFLLPPSFGPISPTPFVCNWCCNGLCHFCSSEIYLSPEEKGVLMHAAFQSVSYSPVPDKHVKALCLSQGSAWRFTNPWTHRTNGAHLQSHSSLLAVWAHPDNDQERWLEL